jgi:hypothetical protein
MPVDAVGLLLNAGRPLEVAVSKPVKRELLGKKRAPMYSCNIDSRKLLISRLKN